MKIVVEVGEYRLEATRQANKTVWLVKEYTGDQETPINTYATTWGELVKTLNGLRKES
jgi:hypothetical protein